MENWGSDIIIALSLSHTHWETELVFISDLYNSKDPVLSILASSLPAWGWVHLKAKKLFFFLMMHLVKILYGLLPRERWPWTEQPHLRDNVIRLTINIHSNLHPYFRLLYSSLRLQILDTFDLAMLSDWPNLPWWVTGPDASVILKLLHEILLWVLLQTDRGACSELSSFGPLCDDRPGTWAGGQPWGSHGSLAMTSFWERQQAVVRFLPQHGITQSASQQLILSHYILWSQQTFQRSHKILNLENV